MRTLAAISLLWLIGLLLGASMLVYTAYVLVAVFWINRLAAKRWTESLSATRTISAQELQIGQTCQIQLQVANQGTWSVLWVILEDCLPRIALFGPPPALELEGKNVRICDVPSKESRVIAYKLKTTRRGLFQIGPTIAETGDILGLHRRFRVVAPPSYILVLPRIVGLAGYDVASARPVGEVKVSYRLFEDPTLVSGIRQYQPGDPIRSIHWRATARTGELQSKQYQPTTVAGATLVLDMHTSSNPDHHEPVRTDLAVTAAASICHALLQMQQQFALISNGRDAADRLTLSQISEEFHSLADARSKLEMHTTSDRLRPIILPTNRGAEHFVQVHQTLARLERSDGMLLEELLVEVEGRLNRQTTALVILQEVTESAALALGMLKRRGYSVAAIVNHHEREMIHLAMGRLLAQSIPVHHLADEASIAEICKHLVLRY